jgi:cytidylate kinase
LSSSEPDPPLKGPQIAIVGPCASGKSTLAAGLKAHGFHARQIAQEHSYVPDMWQVITNPDILIYLDASYETCSRRKDLNWLRREYAEQGRRLEHAREHCHIYLNTDDKSPEKVLESVLDALGEVLGPHK